MDSAGDVACVCAHMDIGLEGFLAAEMPKHSESRVKIDEEASTQACMRVNGKTRAT